MKKKRFSVEQIVAVLKQAEPCAGDGFALRDVTEGALDRCDLEMCSSVNFGP